MKYIVLALLLLAACTAPSDNATRANVANPTDNITVHITDDIQTFDEQNGIVGFEGFGPGKSHEGTFSSWQGTVYFQDGNLVGGEGTIDLTSIEISPERLRNHLLSEDFFDTKNHPEAKITIIAVADDVVTAELTLRGITKAITFPITVTNATIEADFVFDFTEFDWSYTGANDEVRALFTLNK